MKGQGILSSDITFSFCPERKPSPHSSHPQGNTSQLSEDRKAELEGNMCVCWGLG